MSVVCPTVTPTSDDPHEFRNQMEAVIFAPRVQIDLMDGKFAPHKNINPIQVWWEDGTLVDIHLMYEKPNEHLETLISLMPHMIILQAESEGDIESYLAHIQKFGIKAGIAFLPDTPLESAHGCLVVADHAMIFSGNLGSFGGKAKLEYLDKIPHIRAINPKIEIGWDGGINASNAKTLASGGVDVLNVGGAIHGAKDPEVAYRSIVASLV